MDQSDTNENATNEPVESREVSPTATSARSAMGAGGREKVVGMRTGDRPPIMSSEASIISDALNKWITSTDDKLSKLLLLFQEKIQDDLVKDQLFQKLYHDLTNYREDFVFNNITKRVLSIRLFDRVDGMLKVDARQSILLSVGAR
jgi:hypothetical protein